LGDRTLSPFRRRIKALLILVFYDIFRYHIILRDKKSVQFINLDRKKEVVVFLKLNVINQKGDLTNDSIYILNA